MSGESGHGLINVAGSAWCNTHFYKWDFSSDRARGKGKWIRDNGFSDLAYGAEGQVDQQYSPLPRNRTTAADGVLG
jgi:hypothetical protein